MGLLTDFFVAVPDELARLDPTHGPAALFPTVQAKGFDPVELVQLERRLTGETESSVTQPVVVETDETWVIELGSRFAEAIGAMDEKRMERFAEEWLLSDDETAILDQVSTLVRSAADGRRLYVSISL